MTSGSDVVLAAFQALSSSVARLRLRASATVAILAVLRRICPIKQRRVKTLTSDRVRNNAFLAVRGKCDFGIPRRVLDILIAHRSPWQMVAERSLSQAVRRGPRDGRWRD